MGSAWTSAEAPLQNEKDRVHLLQGFDEVPHEAARNVSVSSGLERGVLYLFYIITGFWSRSVSHFPKQQVVHCLCDNRPCDSAEKTSTKSREWTENVCFPRRGDHRSRRKTTPASAERKRLTCGLTFEPAAFPRTLSIVLIRWCGVWLRVLPREKRINSSRGGFRVPFIAEIIPIALLACSVSVSPAALPQRFVSHGQETLSYPGGFDLVPSVAHPARVVRERLAFLPLQARLHLTPPPPNYYGCYRQQRQVRSWCRWLSLSLLVFRINRQLWVHAGLNNDTGLSLHPYIGSWQWRAVCSWACCQYQHEQVKKCMLAVG